MSNEAGLQIATNPTFPERIKHIVIDCHVLLGKNPIRTRTYYTCFYQAAKAVNNLWVTYQAVSLWVGFSNTY